MTSEGTEAPPKEGCGGAVSLQCRLEECITIEESEKGHTELFKTTILAAVQNYFNSDVIPKYMASLEGCPLHWEEEKIQEKKEQERSRYGRYEGPKGETEQDTTPKYGGRRG